MRVLIYFKYIDYTGPEQGPGVWNKNSIGMYLILECNIIDSKKHNHVYTHC